MKLELNPRIRVVESDELEKRPDASGTTHIMYVQIGGKKRGDHSNG